ncbi:MAG: hypothetical protein ABW098_13730 [Candidatus Thiodiazotropha sp.]
MDQRLAASPAISEFISLAVVKSATVLCREAVSQLDSLPDDDLARTTTATS